MPAAETAHMSNWLLSVSRVFQTRQKKHVATTRSRTATHKIATELISMIGVQTSIFLFRRPLCYCFLVKDKRSDEEQHTRSCVYPASFSHQQSKGNEILSSSPRPRPHPLSSASGCKDSDLCGIAHFGYFFLLVVVAKGECLQFRYHRKVPLTVTVLSNSGYVTFAT